MLFCTPVASCYTCVVSCCVVFYSCCPMLCRAVSYCVMLLLVKFSRMDQKNKNAHRSKNENLNTTNLVSSMFFYHRKIYLLFFSVPTKICWKHVLFETMQYHWGFISWRRLFLTFGNLTVIEYKNLCQSK